MRGLVKFGICFALSLVVFLLPFAFPVGGVASIRLAGAVILVFAFLLGLVAKGIGGWRPREVLGGVFAGALCASIILLLFSWQMINAEFSRETSFYEFLSGPLKDWIPIPVGISLALLSTTLGMVAGREIAWLKPHRDQGSRSDL